MQVTIVDAFTKTPGAGNRAGVVLDAAGLSDAVMQRIAAVVGASETAFVLSPPGDPNVHLRYFTPSDEIEFCGHATVATFHLLAERGVLARSGSYRLRCPAGEYAVELEAMGDRGSRPWIVTPQAPWEESPVPLDVVMPLLRGTVQMVERALPVRRNAHRLMIPVTRREDLWALEPRGGPLNDALAPHGLKGIYLFTRDVKEPGSIAHARYFVPGFGIPEDPVTGSAAGPLGAYLALHGVLSLPEAGGTVMARVEQGDAMGKPGRIELEITGRAGKPERSRIGGHAVTVLEGTLHI